MDVIERVPFSWLPKSTGVTVGLVGTFTVIITIPLTSPTSQVSSVITGVNASLVVNKVFLFDETVSRGCLFSILIHPFSDFFYL